MSDLSLKYLQQQIAQQNAELSRLRQELEARQSQFTSLNQRRQALQAELQEVEREMVAVTSGTKVSSPTPKSYPSRKPASKSKAIHKRAAAGSSRNGSLSLPALLVAVARDTRRSLTVEQLAAEVKKRGFKSASANFAGMVKVRVYELAKKGLLKRAADQSGFVLGRAGNQ